MPTLDEILARAGYGAEPTPVEDTNRSLGQWIGDTALSAAGAVAGIPKAIAGLGQLVPGVNAIADPIARGFGDIQESIYAKQSPQAQAARQALGAAIERGDWGGAVGEAFTPANLVDLGLNAFGSLGGMKLLGMGAGNAANFAKLAPWQKAGLLEGAYTSGAIGSEIAGSEGGYSPERLAAIPAGILTGAIGGGMARAFPDIEAAVLGGAATPQRAAEGSILSRLQAMMQSPNAYMRVPMQGAQEGFEEFLQSGQESLWQQLAAGGVDPNQMLAEALVGAVPGAMMGGAFGAYNRPGQPAAQPPGQPAPVPAPELSPEAQRMAMEAANEQMPPTPAAQQGVYDPQAAYRQAIIDRLTGGANTNESGALPVTPGIIYNQMPGMARGAGTGAAPTAPTTVVPQQQSAFDYGIGQQLSLDLSNAPIIPAPQAPAGAPPDMMAFERSVPTGMENRAPVARGGIGDMFAADPLYQRYGEERDLNTKIRQAVLDRLSGLKARTVTPKQGSRKAAAERAIAQLEDLALDDKINVAKLWSALDRGEKQGLTAEEILGTVQAEQEVAAEPTKPTKPPVTPERDLELRRTDELTRQNMKSGRFKNWIQARAAAKAEVQRTEQAAAEYQPTPVTELSEPTLAVVNRGNKLKAKEAARVNAENKKAYEQATKDFRKNAADMRSESEKAYRGNPAPTAKEETDRVYAEAAKAKAAEAKAKAEADAKAKREAEAAAKAKPEATPPKEAAAPAEPATAKPAETPKKGKPVATGTVTVTAGEATKGGEPAAKKLKVEEAYKHLAKPARDYYNEFIGNLETADAEIDAAQTLVDAVSSLGNKKQISLSEFKAAFDLITKQGTTKSETRTPAKNTTEEDDRTWFLGVMDRSSKATKDAWAAFTERYIDKLRADDGDKFSANFAARMRELKGGKNTSITIDEFKEVLTEALKKSPELALLLEQIGLNAPARQSKTPEPVEADDPYVSALASLIDNPSRTDIEVPAELEPVRKLLQRIDKATSDYEADLRAGRLGVALTKFDPAKRGSARWSLKNALTKGDTDQNLLDVFADTLSEDLREIKDALTELYDTVKGGSATIRAAQKATKSAAAGQPQTSPATRFSIYNKAYNDDTLTPDMLSDITWRLSTDAVEEAGKLDPLTKEQEDAAEAAGRLTTRTGFGRIALGESQGKGKTSILDNARKAVMQMYEGTLYDEASGEALTRQHAATEFALRDIIEKNPSPFYRALADLSLNILRQTGLLHRIKVSHFPKPVGSKTATATYKFTRDGVRPGVDLHEIITYGKEVKPKHILHEVVHAFLSAHVINNPTDPGVRILTQMRDLVSKTLAKVVPEYNNLSEAEKTLEFISYALTEKSVVSKLKSTIIQRNSPLGTALTKYLGETGSKIYSIYKGFVKLTKSLLGIKQTDDAYSGYEAFLETFATTTDTILNSAMAVPTAYKAMSPDMKTVELASRSDGDLIETALFDQQDQLVADLEAQARAENDDAKIPSTDELTPQQRRSVTEAKSVVADAASKNIVSLRKRLGYNGIDAIPQMLLNWLPKFYTKHAGEEGEFLASKLRNRIENRPALARLVGGIVDGYGLHRLFRSAMHRVKTRLNIVDAITSAVVHSEELSFNEEMQQKFLDYLRDPTKELKSSVLTKLADAFKSAVDEARAYNILPEALRNADYADILLWNKGKVVSQQQGFKYGDLSKIPTRSNGRIVDGIDRMLGVPQSQTSAKLNAWIKETTREDGSAAYDMAFVNANWSYADQAKAVEDTYGPGYKQVSAPYYKLSDTKAYRPYTFAERKKTDKNASFIRSIATTMQNIEHKLSGMKFNDEMIAENEKLPDKEKYIIKYSEEALAELEKDLGEGRKVIFYDKAKEGNEQKLMRTPGNWVVLRGTKWGALDTEFETYMVPATVYMAIADYNSGNQIINSKTLRLINRVWKKNMTVWSATGHSTNVITNMLISYYNDIPPSNIRRAMEIIYRVKYKPETASEADKAFFDEAERMGAMLGTISTADELGGSILAKQIAAMDETDARKGNSIADHIAAAVAKSGELVNGIRNLGDKADTVLSDIYANEDNVFRLAAYISKVEEMVLGKKGGKLTEAELEKAGKWAADVMVNYDINAKYVNAARQTLWPFLAWPYRMVGQLSRIAVEKPWKLLNTIGAVYLIDALAYTLMAGAGDDRDRDEERDVLPPYMKESIWNVKLAPSYIRMPFGDSGKGIFFGAGRIVPLADLMVINDGMTVPQTAMPGGPIALMLQAVMNYDYFKQQQIMQDGMPTEDKIGAITSFLWRGAAPAITTRAYDAYNKVILGKQGPLGSEATAWVEMARLLGLNFREVDFAEAAYNKDIHDKNLVQKIKSYARRKTNMEMRYANPDYEAIQGIQDDMFNLMNNLMSE